MPANVWSRTFGSGEVTPLASSVLPTPEVPASMKTPMGLLGLSRPAREVWMRLAIISMAWS